MNLNGAEMSSVESVNGVGEQDQVTEIEQPAAQDTETIHVMDLNGAEMSSVVSVDQAEVQEVEEPAA